MVDNLLPAALNDDVELICCELILATREFCDGVNEVVLGGVDLLGS